ncbi:MAG: hypothetical protein LBQ98_00450 [Nitrososphaerota archaeon]|jgi:flavodoxin|nr:hypothetical protein [Nitrososphaerota archaeon]
MDVVVIYSSHRNNTEKVAQAIADQLKCSAVKLTENFDARTFFLASYTLIFLGTGIRGGEPYVELQNFIKTAKFKSGVRFVLFMTWAGGGASNRLAYEVVKRQLEAIGQRLDDDYFICLGQTFGFTHRGRPNVGDLVQAKIWSQQKLQSVE